MSKEPTMKNNVGFITHSRGTHVTTVPEAGDPVPAADVDGRVMNSKKKTEKCSNLVNWEKEAMQMTTLGLSWASKPTSVSTRLGILRSQARVGSCSKFATRKPGLRYGMAIAMGSIHSTPRGVHGEHSYFSKLVL
jgi:hypothetical protein